MGYVLVDDPEAVFVYGEDERVADLAERAEGGERGQGGIFVVGIFRGVEGGGAAVVGNRLRDCLGEAAFESPGYRDGGVRLDGDSAFELEARGDGRSCWGLQGEAAVGGFVRNAGWGIGGRGEVGWGLPFSGAGGQS